MPKIRALHPSFFTDENVVAISPLARLLFQGLWCYACDNGHVVDKPRQLKLRILPADDASIDELLSEIEGEGMIVRGDGWIFVPNLTGRQRPDKRYFLTCDHPDCSDSSGGEASRNGQQYGNHQRWHVARGLVKPGCEFCPAEPGHDDENASSSHRDPIVTTTSAHRKPIVTTSFPHRDHIADGDGDGDGDGDEVVTSVGGRGAGEGDTAPRKRGRRLPEDFIPSESARATILSEAPTLDLRREHAKFVDHWAAAPGQRGVKLDWDATWRNWMRRAADEDARKPRSRQQETDDLFEAAMARARVADAADQLTIEGRIQ